MTPEEKSREKFSGRLEVPGTQSEADFEAGEEQFLSPDGGGEIVRKPAITREALKKIDEVPVPKELRADSEFAGSVLGQEGHASSAGTTVQKKLARLLNDGLDVAHSQQLQELVNKAREEAKGNKN